MVATHAKEKGLAIISPLDLDDKRLTPRLYNDQLEVDRFPFHAIDQIENYHNDHTSLGNYFVR